MQLPILTITGMYDDDQPGALAHYQALHASGFAGRAGAALPRSSAPGIIAGTRTPKQEFGGMKFGPASLVDLPQLHLDWYRLDDGGRPKPEFLQKAGCLLCERRRAVALRRYSGSDHRRVAALLSGFRRRRQPRCAMGRGA